VSILSGGSKEGQPRRDTREISFHEDNLSVPFSPLTPKINQQILLKDTVEISDHSSHVSDYNDTFANDSIANEHDRNIATPGFK